MQASVKQGINQTQVRLGNLVVWFSYETAVAYRIDGHEPVVSTNKWGPTTAKHLAAVDGGGKEAAKTRLPHAAVLDSLERALSEGIGS